VRSLDPQVLFPPFLCCVGCALSRADELSVGNFFLFCVPSKMTQKPCCFPPGHETGTSLALYGSSPLLKECLERCCGQAGSFFLSCYFFLFFLVHFIRRGMLLIASWGTDLATGAVPSSFYLPDGSSPPSVRRPAESRRPFSPCPPPGTRSERSLLDSFLCTFFFTYAPVLKEGHRLFQRL